MITTGTGVDIEEEQNISEASLRRNKIADDMWRQYQQVLHERSLAGFADEGSDEDTDEGSDEGSDDSDNDFYV